jgi:arginine decarboxylase
MPENSGRSEPIPSFSLAESRLVDWENLLNAAQGLVQDESTSENDHGAVTAMLTDLEPLEFYWGFPGKAAIRELKRYLGKHAYPEFLREVAVILWALKEESYRYWLTTTIPHAHPHELKNCHSAEEISGQRQGFKPYFEVLIVDASNPSEESGLHEALRRMRHADDSLVYDCIKVPSVEDAVLAVLVNFNIQALLVRGNPKLHASNGEMSRAYIAGLDEKDLDPPSNITDLSDYLSQVITRLRPELDLYFIEEASGDGAQGVSGASFDGTFHDRDSPVDLHLAILRGVEKRRKTPFFDSMKEYSQRSTDAFHASPLSRGASVRNSRWIRGIEDFYGNGISVATTGGLVSLLSPSEPLRRAQELAAQTFGAERTFFVTNGTSTANKIVVQAVLRPGDVVLADHDCHKSHQYGFVLSGAQVCYLEPYHLSQFALYGAVPTAEILNHLLLYKHAGKLSLVRMLLLTNCTFDGIVYNVENVMQAALSIKPDLVFLWDEAWFAFASFHPTYRRRTAMHVAAKLRRRYCTPAYREEYRQWCRTYPDETMRDIERRAGCGLPDPDLVRIRVYSTQSTHKTLTAFRQASMIHVHDQDFEKKVATQGPYLDLSKL